MASVRPENYFSKYTLSHLKPQQGLSERYLRRAQDVTLACKLTHVYGKILLTSNKCSVPPRQQFILPDKVIEVERFLLAQANG